jgi:hypothetical protein
LAKRFFHVPAAPSLRFFSRGTFDQIFSDKLGISCFVVVLKFGLNQSSENRLNWNGNTRNWFSKKLADGLPAVCDVPNEETIFWHDFLYSADLSFVLINRCFPD